MEERHPRREVGKQRFGQWRNTLLATPEARVQASVVSMVQQVWLDLVEARMSRGMTPEDIARQEGIPLLHVKRIEECETMAGVPLTSLQKYASAVGRTLQIVVVEAK